MLQEILNSPPIQRVIRSGFYVKECKACNCLTVVCPECGNNCCNGFDQCGTCPASQKVQSVLSEVVEKMIEDRMWEQ